MAHFTRIVRLIGLLAACLMLTAACMGGGSEATPSPTQPAAATPTTASSAATITPTQPSTVSTASPSPAASTPEGSPTADGAVTVTGGVLEIEFDDEHEDALDHTGIAFQATGEAKQSGHHEVDLPVVSGTFNPSTSRGHIELAGGMSFSTAAGSVTFDNVVLDLDDEVMTAEHEGQRLTLFELDLTRLDIGHHRDYDFNVDDIEASFSSDASSILNDGLGVDIFGAGLRVEMELKLRR